MLNILLKCDVKERTSEYKRVSDTKYDLRQAKDDFNLWDGVHGRDVLKHLEQFAKWEPGKKEREKRERLAQVAMMEAQLELESETLGGLPGENVTRKCFENLCIIHWQIHFQQIYVHCCSTSNNCYSNCMFETYGI